MNIDNRDDDNLPTSKSELEEPIRADLGLVELGLASSRQRAQALIQEGRVFLINAQGQRVAIKKASQILDLRSGARLELAQSSDPEFVSRGGLKLHGALQKLRELNLSPPTQLTMRGSIVLDIGVSTGGFTDCCLQSGASLVVGVDVGHDQLAPALRHDSRVKIFERWNARELDRPELREQLLQATNARLFDWVVMDLSFISQRLVLPALLGSGIEMLKPDASLLTLVKPQFELGREALGKGGIVKDEKRRAALEPQMRDFLASLGWTVLAYFPSPILGSDGNQEFFLYARPPQQLNWL
jgi:23S rRNA (cytidine1920-2'-O)/16S rRNA (cytidine1409-2'-O)-methyltransferase